MIARHYVFSLALLLLASSQDCNPPAPATGAGATLIRANKKALFVVDKTQSGDDDALKQFAAQVKNWLSGCAELREVVVVPVGVNGKGVWQAPVQKFLLPDDPRQPFDEAAEREKVRKRCDHRRPCEDKLIAEAKAAYEKERDEKFAQYQKNHAQVVNAVMAAVLQRSTVEPACTNIGEMADLIAQSKAHYLLWLSDAAHSCRTTLQPQKFTGKVLLGLLPLAHETDGDLTKRQDTMRGLYPDATIKPVVTLSEQELRDFFRAS